MEKSQQFHRVVFSAEAIREAQSAIPGRDDDGAYKIFATREVARSGATWDFDSDDEFYAEYSRGFAAATYDIFVGQPTQYRFRLAAYPESTSVILKGPDRASIERISNVLEKYRSSCTLPEPPPPPLPPPPPKPVVFIGHGRSSQWRDLKDHLQDQHGYEAEAYEVGARAGHAIRDILQTMLARSSFALLVMTGEDEMADGTYRPRENVVHEAGLFQGRLGFSRAVVLVEDGVEPFSNLQGIQQLRYSKGNIRETFGDVVATLRREFES